jgi:hypothetical protein
MSSLSEKRLVLSGILRGQSGQLVAKLTSTLSYALVRDMDGMHGYARLFLMDDGE